MSCGVEASADGKGTPIVLKHEAECPEIKVIEREAALGLATTRELILELIARAEVSLSGLSDPLERRPYGFMLVTVKRLLTVLPEEALAYRTVD